jgi:hypothetical protein
VPEDDTTHAEAHASGDSHPPFMVSGAGSNRLAVLADEIRVAHAGVIAAATVAAERAIEAGKALTEAKELVPHGEWIPWLKEHCQISVRTAQAYMKIVRLGLTAPVVAEMGLKAAGDVFGVFVDEGYDPFCHFDEEQQRQWCLFTQFIGDSNGAHVEWIIQRQFVTPDEWLGPEGAAFRKAYAWPEIGQPCRNAWAAFQIEYQHKTREEIDAEIVISRERAEESRPAPKRRRRRKNATVAHLPDHAASDAPKAEPQDQPDLADRIRALMVENDPDVLRAGLAAVAAELDGRGGVA